MIQDSLDLDNTCIDKVSLNGLLVVLERTDALFASFDLAGETAHAALVVHAAVVKIHQFYFGICLACTVHGTLQQLCRIAILTRDFR